MEAEKSVTRERIWTLSGSIFSLLFGSTFRRLFGSLLLTDWEAIWNPIRLTV